MEGATVSMDMKEIHLMFVFRLDAGKIRSWEETSVNVNQDTEETPTNTANS